MCDGPCGSGARGPGPFYAGPGRFYIRRGLDGLVTEGELNQAALGALVGQGADGAQVLSDRRGCQLAVLEADTVALDEGAAERAALGSVPGEKQPQGGAIAAAGDVRVQAIGD